MVRERQWIGIDMHSADATKLRAWLTENTSFPADAGDSLDLIESGVLTSLQMMEFVLFLENLCGQTVDLDRSTLETFRTVTSITDTYLTPAGSI